MTIQIIHNPRCTKSRQTLALLQENGVEPEVILYLKTPLDSEQLAAIKQKLGIAHVREMMRTKEAEYKTQNLSQIDDEPSLIQAIVETPKLLERPIVINEERARIGRPPENVLDII